MKRLVSFVFALGLLVSGSAFADHRPQPAPPFPSHPPQPGLALGTFCSAAASDGNWGVYFGYSDVFTTCEQVRTALVWRTRAPITGWNRGYWRVNGLNYVYVRCAFSWNQFQGFGSQPLQTAYNWANLSGGQSCLFDVR